VRLRYVKKVGHIAPPAIYLTANIVEIL